MQNKPLKIYYDGQYSRWETYKPVVEEKLCRYWDKINYWFEHQGEWPTNDRLDTSR